MERTESYERNRATAQAAAESPRDGQNTPKETPQKTYEDALGRLFPLRAGGIKLDLARVRQAARALGDPHLRYPAFHIGGTNGKGSTAVMLERILSAQGYRTGLYTSPHLHRFTERIRVCEREIEQAAVAELVPWLLGRFPELTFFEIATLLAFEVFRQRAVDVAVVEVGLGGRLDATNILRLPLATGITSIGLDHEQILGSSRVAIAREKACIFKPGRPAVVSLGATMPEAERVQVQAAISQIAEQVGAPLRIAGRDFGAIPVPAPGHGFRYFGPGSPGGIQAGVLCKGAIQRPQAGDRWIAKLGLAGSHQMDNAAVALAMLGCAERETPVTESAIAEGLATAAWPGRFETLTDLATLQSVVLDGAHNPDGAAALASALAELPPAPTTIVFGVLEDKAAAQMLRMLVPLADRLILVAPPNDRARPPAELARAVLPAIRTEQGAASGKHPREVLLATSVSDALAKIGYGDVEQSDERVVITGSLYLVAEARAVLTGAVQDALALSDPSGRVAAPSPPYGLSPETAMP